MSGGAEEITSEISEWQKNLTARHSEIDHTWKDVQALVVRYGDKNRTSQKPGGPIRLLPKCPGPRPYPCILLPILCSEKRRSIKVRPISPTLDA